MVSDIQRMTLMQMASTSLNPCCNGIWSQTQPPEDFRPCWRRLNPCCNGIWSQTYCVHRTTNGHKTVLILVVMEYGLRRKGNKNERELWRVLILVVMEYGLRHFVHKVPMLSNQKCLNPCCNGIWSQTNPFLEDSEEKPGLNPCCNGIWSQTLQAAKRKGNK